MLRMADVELTSVEWLWFPYIPFGKLTIIPVSYTHLFDVFVRGKWKPTRIEYGDNWYLVGIRAEDLNGLRVLSLIHI